VQIPYVLLMLIMSAMSDTSWRVDEKTEHEDNLVRKLQLLYAIRATQFGVGSFEFQRLAVQWNPTDVSKEHIASICKFEN
jgi:hypothetical protein